MARFPGVCNLVPGVAGILAAFASFNYFEPTHQSLWVAQPTQVYADAGPQAVVTPVSAEAAEPDRSAAKKTVTLKANALGHFNVTAEINGMPVDMMADTGATYVALSFRTALSLGLQPSDMPFDHETDTANGVMAVAPVVLEEMRIGGIVVRRVQAVVTAPGRLRQNLLGMSFINRLSRFEMSGQRLTLKQ